jgi:hypothetical protein
MWPYWLLFFIPALQAITKLKQNVPTLSGTPWTNQWRAVFVFITLMIGMRHKVGGDWGIYLVNMNARASATFLEVLSLGTHGDPADTLLNWFAANSGLGIYFVNSVSALLFTFGLIVFCRDQPRPWLALTVAVPYLITVVAMGYTRQGVAIGVAMLGLVSLRKQSTVKFLILVALAASFHKSAVILVPLAVLANSRYLWKKIVLVGVVGGLLFVLLLMEYVDQLVNGYIYAEYESSGAAIRIAMNALPATLFLLIRRRFHLPPEEQTFWTWMALGALAFIALLYVSPSSTAVDRVALYWIPLQLFVWSRVPDAMGGSGGKNTGWVYAVVAYSAAVHFVWLFFATHAGGWLPYQSYFWVWLWQ